MKEEQAEKENNANPKKVMTQQPFESKNVALETGKEILRKPSDQLPNLPLVENEKKELNT